MTLRCRIISPDGVAYEVAPAPTGPLGRFLTVETDRGEVRCPLVKIHAQTLYFQAPAAPAPWEAPHGWRRVSPTEYWILSAYDCRYLKQLHIDPEE